MSVQDWAYISRVIEGPSPYIQELLDRGCEVSEIAQGLRERASWLGPLLKASESRYEYPDAAKDLYEFERLGGRLLYPGCEEWPGEIVDSAFAFAASGTSEHVRSYQEDAVAPHCLWVLGEGNLRALCAQAVAIVGTRAASTYGTEVTRMFVADLVANHWTIISGGALGIDAVAHQEAIHQGKPTIVVSAAGADVCYPSAHRVLFQRIQERGLIISEYPPGSRPYRHRFLTRNRLVAALSQGTVVVEAAWRSGALNTLSWATGLGKVAMAVPGPVTNMNSLGCHSRIKNQEANLVCSGEEVRALLGKLGTVDPDAQYELQFQADPVQRLSRNELRVFDALGSEPVIAQEVAKSSGLTLGLSVHILVALERQGLIRRQANGWARGEYPHLD